MSDHIVEINQTNAQQTLIEESMTRPVVVDFWAESVEPCKTLRPILQKLAIEYAGQFLLATIDCEREQMIASQFGVRNLPTVMVIKDGQPVDGFAGAQSEPAIREMLDKHLPKPWDTQFQQAQLLIEADNFQEATTLLRTAYHDSQQQANIAKSLAKCLIEINRFDEAGSILEQIKLADQDSLYEQLVAQLELKQQAEKAPEIQALEEKLNQNPGDFDTAYQLAVQFSQHNHYRDALELLITILQTDREFQNGAARKALLDIIKTLGSQDPLASEYQRRLYSLLY